MDRQQQGSAGKEGQKEGEHDGNVELFLHFDINKTLIISDSAGGKSVDHVINDIVAGVAWGKQFPAEYDGEKKDLDWEGRIVVDGQIWVPLEPRIVSVQSPGKDCITFADFIYKLTQIPSDSSFTKDQKYTLYTGMKEKRKHYLNNFTDEGKPGHRYRDYYHKLHSELYKEISTDDASAAAGDGNSTSSSKRIFEVFLLPSFFNLILHLVQSKRKFAIIFRTFGHDIQLVVDEFNNFCSGKHPLYPGVALDGSNPDHQLKDLRLSKESFKTNVSMIHHIESDTSVHLVVGTIDRSNNKDRNETLNFYKSQYTVHSGFKNIYQYLTETASKSFQSQGGATLAVQDEYSWWASHNESSHAGKCHIFDPKDLNHHSIFFDDNYFPGDDQSIIDCRDLNGSVVMEVENVYAVKVEPFEAILNGHYFIECLMKCEENRKVTNKAGTNQ